MIGRVRLYKTKDSTVQIFPDEHVLPRYLHGGDWALGKSNTKSGGGSKPGGLPRIKLRYPPADGWKGGDWKANLGFAMPQKSGGSI